MGLLRKDAAFYAVVVLLLGMLAVGMDARPADPAESAPAPTVTTRPVADVAEPEPDAPAGPATFTQEAPAEASVAARPEREFVLADEPMRLLAGEEAISQPGAVGRLRIASIALDAEVVPTGVVRKNGQVIYDAPNFAVGQYRGVNPGQGGNVVLAGHVGTRDGSGGAIFARLREVSIGDKIMVDTATASLTYRVREVRFVEPDAVHIMRSQGREQLTLITCHECNVDCNRLVVIAEPIATTDAV